MLGAIAGDIIGSTYEFDNHRSTDFPLFRPRSSFTDDTVLTCAVADSILNGTDLVDAFHAAYRRYPHVGWGARFARWAAARSRQPYGSYGNGSAMRASPCGWAYDTEEEVVAAADRSAIVTHDHPDGIAGARAVALGVWMARAHIPKTELVDELAGRFGYPLDRSVAELRETNTFDETCRGTLPVALRVFAESEDFEHAVRLAVSVGGDSDTIACIVGALAEAYYGRVPPLVADEARARLDTPLLQITDQFRRRYMLR